MEVKIWDNSFNREDVEVLVGKAITDGEWEIVVDELYNNDTLYNAVAEQVAKVAKAALE
jgi:hypothetical protein